MAKVKRADTVFSLSGTCISPFGLHNNTTSWMA